MDEDTYKSYCDRLMAYISKNLKSCYLILSYRHPYYEIRVCHHDLHVNQSTLIHRELTCKELYYRLTDNDVCKPFNPGMSIEEVDLQLQIRGY